MIRVALLLALLATPLPGNPVEDVRGCTVVTVSFGDSVYFGCNNDYIIQDFAYWVSPGTGSSYGAVFFGEPDNVQQGFNEKGLAYDANGLPSRVVSEHPGTKWVPGGHGSYIVTILRQCANVDDVVEWVQDHAWHDSMHYQMHFADSTGDAVIISVGRDATLSFARKPAGNSYLVSTNFNVANPANGSYPCWRYDRATTMLDGMQHSGSVSEQSVSDVMEAVHVESPATWTFLTVVGDLRSGRLRVYYLFQYDDPIYLDIADELAAGPRQVQVSSLFPEETREAGASAYAAMMQRQDRLALLAPLWVGLVGISVVAAAALGRGRGVTIAGIALPLVWGPFGLLPSTCRVQRGRRVPQGGWNGVVRHGLIATGGALVPLGIVTQLLVTTELGVASSAIQLLAILVVPHAFAILLLFAPMHARASGLPYLRAVGRVAPGTFTLTNLCLGLLLPVVLPLAFLNARSGGSGLSAVLTFWFIAAVGTIPIAALVGLYHNLLRRFGPCRHAVALVEHRLPHDVGVRPFRRRRWYGALWSIFGLLLLLIGAAVSTRTLRAAQTRGAGESCATVAYAGAIELSSETTRTPVHVTPLRVTLKSDDASYVVPRIERRRRTRS